MWKHPDAAKLTTNARTTFRWLSLLESFHLVFVFISISISMSISNFHFQFRVVFFLFSFSFLLSTFCFLFFSFSSFSRPYRVRFHIGKCSGSAYPNAEDRVGMEWRMDLIDPNPHDGVFPPIAEHASVLMTAVNLVRERRLLKWTGTGTFDGVDGVDGVDGTARLAARYGAQRTMYSYSPCSTSHPGVSSSSSSRVFRVPNV